MTRRNDIWIQTVSGMDVDLLYPRPESILLGDIAHALARIPRFVGHTIGECPWSVAQHSLLVESLMPEDANASERLVALLHDAHEAYVGDMPTPVKQAMDAIPRNNSNSLAPSLFFKDITNRLDTVIWKVFGLDPSSATFDRVRTADLLALRVEADLLMAPRRREWSTLLPAPDPMPTLRPCHPVSRAEAVFLDRFHELQEERHGLTRIASVVQA
jgi:5'-nucleotidase